MGLYIDEDTLQAELLRMNFCHILIGCLSADSPLLLRKAATDFIMTTGRFPDITNAFIDQKVLDW